MGLLPSLSEIKNFLNNFPVTGRLFVVKYIEGRKKVVALTCECGEKRNMLFAELGVRCQKCGILHDHYEFEKLRRRCFLEARAWETVNCNSPLEALQKMNAKIPRRLRKMIMMDRKTKRIFTRKDFKYIKSLKQIE